MDKFMVLRNNNLPKVVLIRMSFEDPHQRGGDPRAIIEVIQEEFAMPLRNILNLGELCDS